MMGNTNDIRNWSVIRKSADACSTLLPGPADVQVKYPRRCLVETPDGGDAVPLCTDEQILDESYQALQASGYGQLRNVGVNCENGRVELYGRISTYHMKQVAQSVLKSIAGIRGIQNNLQVAGCR